MFQKNFGNIFGKSPEKVLEKVRKIFLERFWEKVLKCFGKEFGEAIFICSIWITTGILTDAVPGLPADGGGALDVGSGRRHVVVAAQLRQKVLDQVDEHQVPTGHHQVTQSHDGPLQQPITGGQ